MKLYRCFALPSIFIFWIFGVSETYAGPSDQNLTTTQQPSEGTSCIEAARLLGEAIKLSNSSEQEENLYRRAVTLCPEMAEAQHNLAVVLEHSGKREEALQLARKALELKDDPNFRVTLGLMFVTDGKLEEAKQQFDKALEKNPANIKALQGIALVWDKQNRPDLALDNYSKAKSLDQRNTLTLYNFGVLYSKRKMWEAAQSELEQCLRLDPTNYECCLYLSLAYRNGAKPDESEKLLKRAAELKPNGIEVYQGLAELYLEQKDIDKAELALRRVLSLKPKDVGALTNLGIVLFEKKLPAQSVEQAKKALGLNPQNGPALLLLGLCQLELDDLENAERSIKLAMDFGDSAVPAHKALASVYQKQGKNDEARVELELAGKDR